MICPTKEGMPPRFVSTHARCGSARPASSRYRVLQPTVRSTLKHTQAGHRMDTRPTLPECSPSRHGPAARCCSELTLASTATASQPARTVTDLARQWAGLALFAALYGAPALAVVAGHAAFPVTASALGHAPPSLLMDLLRSTTIVKPPPTLVRGRRPASALPPSTAAAVGLPDRAGKSPA